MLQLDEKQETYLLEGVPLPRVTSVIKAVGLTSNFYTEEGRARGRKVHEILESYDNGDPLPEDISPLDPGEVAGYVRAYEGFLSEYRVEVLEVESSKHHPRYLYAGTIDRFILLNGVPAVLDFKTGSHERWMRLQTSAYANLYPKPPKRFVLCLKKDGSYTLKEHDKDVDFRYFLFALNLYNFNQGLIP